MKSSMPVDIHPDVFVAVKAELALSFLVKYFVARRAFSLNLCMVVYDLTGHNERLNVLSSRVM
jgi:hypothetical protein